MTGSQAGQRAEQYVRDAFGAFPPSAHLELQSADTISCGDPSDHGPKGRVTAGNAYWIRGLPKEQNAQHFEVMLRWWTDHDFVVLKDDRPKRNYLWVENKQDGFRMALDENPDGNLILGADSPCVWPNGTPEAR